MKRAPAQRAGATLFTLFLLTFSPVRAFANAPACYTDAIRELVEKRWPAAMQTLLKSEELVQKLKLPYQRIELGPPERKVSRLFIGIDATNAAEMQAYRDAFALEKPLGDGAPGTLVLEFQNEITPNSYVTGVLRRSSDTKEKMYRWGRPDMVHEEWWNSWIVQPGPQRPIYGYSHVLGLSEAEQKNVIQFLDNPQLRAPCKSDNCVAWTSSIELGRTADGATPEERKFLFSELGMARSMAHFEIGRRLVRASNERHGVVYVFYNGEAGRKEFVENLIKHLPPDPKIPYQQIIKNLKFDAASPIVKAAEQVPDGAKVLLPIAAGASPEGAAALFQRAIGLEKGMDFYLFTNGISEKALAEATQVPGNKVRLKAMFLGHNLRALHREGKVDVIPGFLSNFADWMGRKPELQFDAVLVRVSPPDAQGRMSLGPNHDLVMEAIRQNPKIKIIAEVNPNIPRTTGDNFILAEQITARFDSNAALASPPKVPLTAVETKIGENLSALLENGTTVQIGIGNLFDGLPQAVKARGLKGMKVHTELFGDAMKEMMEAGVIDEARTTFAYGSEAMYKWLDGNSKVVFESTKVLNDPANISKVENFRAINTALQVNLRGDVNATMGPNGTRVSSPGGQVDFMSGAVHSVGGKSIIAIRSTAKNDTLSTIVLNLYAGPVTTNAELVTNVVTEYGIADLAGKTERERAIALIQIAHPKFRRTIFNEALAAGLVRDGDAALIEMGAQ